MEDRRHRRFRPFLFAVVVVCTVGLGSCSTADAPPVVPLIDEDEPGPRLTVAGRVVDATTGDPIEGADVVVYQTDHSGRYQPSDPSDESTARIRGELRSDGDGSFSFLTVQPGEYPDQPPGNRHIHFHTVSAQGYAPKGFVLLFDDNVAPTVRSWAEATGFGVIIPLDGDPASGLSGFVEIGLEPEA